MSGWRAGRRRGLAIASIAVCALSLSLAIPGMVSGAGAIIANPGNVEFSMNGWVVTPLLTLSGLSTQSTATATLQPNGSFTIAHTAIVFSPVNVNIGPPFSAIGDVTVQLVATTDFVGIVDPANHVEVLAGQLEMLWSQPGTMTGCPVGPFDVHLTTQSPGARPYAPTSGAATMVDDNFAIPALATGAPGCGGLESYVNSTLSLPITTTTTTTGSAPTTTTTTTTTPLHAPSRNTLLPDTPDPAIVLSMTLSPAPRAATPPPGQTATTTARTTPPTKATTTSAPKRPPVTVAHTPKPAPGKQSPVIHPKPLHATHPPRHHKHHTTRHVKRHKQATTRRRTTVRKAPTPRRTQGIAPTPITSAGDGYRPFARRTPKAHPAQSGATPFNPTLISSRHRASPSALNILALLALAVSGAFAIRLMSPDLGDLVRSRSKRRGRLFGIDALQPPRGPAPPS